MKYILDFRPDSLDIMMEGRFTFDDARRFRQLMSLIIDEHDRCDVCLDISRLDFVDSTAMRLLMMTHDLAKKMHRSLVFQKPHGQVERALQEAAEYNVLNIDH